MNNRSEAVSKAFPHAYDGDGNKVCSYCGGALTCRSIKYCSENCRNLANVAANPHQRHITIPLLSRHCWLCGIEVTPSGPRDGCLWWRSNAEIHHIMPVIDGGENKLENLVALCHDCHVLIHNAIRFHRKIYDDMQKSNFWPKKKAQMTFQELQEG